MVGETEKICKKCGVLKPISMFGKRRYKYKNTNEYRFKNECNDCLNIYYKKYSKTHESISHIKRRYIQQLKNIPCIICGKQYEPLLMDFDHLGNKFKNMASMVGYSYDMINKEFAKCQVLCIFCHKEKTHLKIKSKEIVPITPGLLETYTISQRKKNLAIKAKENPCYICGKQYPYYQMELDHQNGYEKFDRVSTLVFYGVDDQVIIDEINKTLPICCACHRIKSINEQRENNFSKKNASGFIYEPKKNRKPRYRKIDKDIPIDCSKCKKCNEVKKFELFSPRADAYNGRQSLCRECSNADRRLRRKRKRELIIVLENQSHCSKCNQIKNIDNFPKHNSTKNGYGSWCKDCYNTYRRNKRKSNPR